MPAMQCTSCGAPLEVKNRFTKVLVCSYCGTHLAVGDSGLTIAGTHAKLADFPSIFSVGSRGTILGKPFTALGRMRYQYSGGHFDEWFLEYDGGQAWFTEDDGTFSIYFESEEAVEYPDITAVRPGQNVKLGTRTIMVKEKGSATVQGAEGELSYYVEPGTKVTYMDGIADGKKISIEATDEEIELFIGRPLLSRDIVVNKA